MLGIVIHVIPQFTDSMYRHRQSDSDPAEEISHGDERVRRQSKESKEREPHRGVDLAPEPVHGKPVRPQMVARCGRGRRRHQEICQDLQRNQTDKPR